MGNSVNIYKVFRIINLIENPIIFHPNAPLRTAAAEFFGVVRTRLII
jgi:hypothetical protein